MRRGRVVTILTLVLTDAAMSLLAFYVAYILRVVTQGSKIGPFHDYVILAGIQLVNTLLVFFIYKFYHRRHAALLTDELYRIFGAVSVATLVTVAFIGFVLHDTLEYQRSMLVFAWLATLGTITLGRFAHSRVQRRLQRRGIGAERVLIIGTGEVGRMIFQKIQHTPGLGYRVVGFADIGRGPALQPASGQTSVMSLPVLGTVDELPAIIEAQGIGEVIIGLPEASHQELVGIISLCEREKVSIRVFPDVFQIMASEVTISDLGGLPLLTIRDVALRGWKLTLKRMVDIAGSSLMLLFISPLMMLVAFLVKLDSPGPVFFAQDRMGLDAKPFKVLKFRSMRQDAEANGPGWTTKDDPRRTRVGVLIRKTSIDELPQFINVLMGDMSLVGPRPEQPSYVEQFRQSIPRYMDRHREKAGLTGWAQINGLRGDTSIAERTKYDLWYIENWSLWLDFKIILRTAFNMFTDKTAY
ncbi:MAG: undecaprenyl-phosphate glucose phosphotransferase [Chloroflexi bacterium]|nr:undecaprenyl-phosphate glucose phosphotransferase [Chloroflexota bacterium]